MYPADQQNYISISGNDYNLTDLDSIKTIKTFHTIQTNGAYLISVYETILQDENDYDYIKVYAYDSSPFDFNILSLTDSTSEIYQIKGCSAQIVTGGVYEQTSINDFIVTAFITDESQTTRGITLELVIYDLKKTFSDISNVITNRLVVLDNSTTVGATLTSSTEISNIITIGQNVFISLKNPNVIVIATLQSTDFLTSTV